LFKSIAIKNLLSFGPDTPELPLENLNVLIGPNGSGKSNLMEAIALLRSTPHGDSSFGLRNTVLSGGGIGEWIWKGNSNEPASVDAVINYPIGRQNVRHYLAIRHANQSVQLEDERIENEKPSYNETDVYFFYRYQNGNPSVNVVDSGGRHLAPAAIERDLSVLAQLRDTETFPELSFLQDNYRHLKLYREWHFGKRDTPFRGAQKTDTRNDILEENFSNIALFLNRLRRDYKTKKTLLSAFVNLYEGLTDFDVSIEGGTVQVFFSEGEFVIPATRLSEGSVRFLCLLAILCDPNPPPFIGIEEPEIGLHPDILPKIAELLIEASQRTQLVVTTHSDVLVDALSEHPSAVVVCEKHAGQTSMKRLDPQELTPWLEKYRLGQLWSKGELGGNRW
jgi:predicted ATPase